MPIDFEIQQGLRFVFTNLPNLMYASILLQDLLYIMFFHIKVRRPS